MFPAPRSLFSSTFFLVVFIISLTFITAASRFSPIPTLTSVNATLTAANDVHCVDSPDWVTRTFWSYDCFTAIGLFEDYDVYRHSTTMYEFLSSSIPLLPHRPFTQRTPRKYTYRSCTMAIVMLIDLPSSFGGLPAPRRWASTDLAHYQNIYAQVLNVRDGCLSIVDGDGDGGDLGDGGGKGGGGDGNEGKGGNGNLGFRNPVGYNTAGVNGAVGVFLWDTNSPLNEAVKEYVGLGPPGIWNASMGGSKGTS